MGCLKFKIKPIWQAELFFERLRQGLEIKKSRGATENAARIQAGVAIIACRLAAVARRELEPGRSIHGLPQISGVSPTGKTPMREPFERRATDIPDASTTPFLHGLFD